MKLILSILFVFAFCLPASAQKDSSECTYIIDSITQRKVYIFTDKMPEATGGNDSLMEIIYANIEYPIGPCYSGKVWVAFIVESNGKITGKRILKDPSKNIFGNQILDAIEKAKWVPGSCAEKAVPILYKLPVTIDLK